ncbi:hypothetical protein ZIOFF_034780 [Zingiber officinale]|uniref:Nuclear pore complex protein Nup85 n=1 Tax=Zingiber officinale TaxID=94328 RepID=A0A8J5GDV4_ZINOF|nr:hypothetical protein ZIOFF_034780 [Zingiber officinale]
MPGRLSDPGADTIVPISLESRQPVVLSLRHGVSAPVFRVYISWSRGSLLHVACLRPPSLEPDGAGDDEEEGGKVVEVRLGTGDGGISEAQMRRIAYGSVPPFVELQSWKNSLASLSMMSSSSFRTEKWQYILEYSRKVNELLKTHQIPPDNVIEDPRIIVKMEVVSFQLLKETSSLRAAWELMEIFFIDKQSLSWLPERLVDWLEEYDSLVTRTDLTVYSKLVAMQKKLVDFKVIEDNPDYWEAVSSALAVGWLDTVRGNFLVLQAKLLRLHGSYQLDQLDDRETENGLVEAVAVLILTMPRLCPDLSSEKIGQCYDTKPDFIKAWEKWRGQGLEGLNNLAQKCQQLKPTAEYNGLMSLLMGILQESPEAVLAECSRTYGPWMVAHGTELLAAGSDYADIQLHEERYNLGSISIEELHWLVYAQVLSSHPLTWQIVIVLANCIHISSTMPKARIRANLDLSRSYDLDNISASIMKIAGMHHWKHGRKGFGIYWLQLARDEVRLNRIAQQLFEFIGRSLSDDSFQQWEGLIELLGTRVGSSGGLEFLHKYRDLKRLLKQVEDGRAVNAARLAAESLVQLMKSPSTPQQFWLPLLYDSVSLLNWKAQPLLRVSETNLLLNKLQDLSMAKMCPGFVDSNLPSHALSSVRLALAKNLGRAILEEC